MSLPRPDDALDRLVAVASLDDDRARIVFPDGWQQGRGVFGGLVTAVLARALEGATEGRPLRSLTAEICGPVQPGEATLVLERLREGSAVTTAAVRLVQGGEVLAHGVGVLGKARTAAGTPTGVRVEIPPPVMPPWREMAPVAFGPPAGPAFGSFFELRCSGPPPFSGAAVAEAEGWIKPKNPGARRDVAYLAACVDAFWPSIFAREPAPRPMATIAFTLQPFPRFEGLSPDAPLFYRARLLAADEGYCVEHRELWGEDGRLLALNEQTFVIIK